MKKATRDGGGDRHVELDNGGDHELAGDLDDTFGRTADDHQPNEHPIDRRPLLRQLAASRLYQFDLRNASYFAAIEPRHVTIVCRSTQQPLAWFYGIHKSMLADLLANPNVPGNSGLDRRLERLFNDLTHGVAADDVVAMSLYAVEPSRLGLGSAHSLALAFGRALPGLEQKMRRMNPLWSRPALVIAAAGGVTSVPRPTDERRHWLLIDQAATRVLTQADIDQITDPETSPYQAFEWGDEDWDPSMVAM